MTQVPFLPHRIDAHRVVGDGRGAMLMRPDGTIDWWCAPRIDSPPLLWSLLDPDGGAARWTGGRAVSWPEDPAGPTARRTLTFGGQGGRGDTVECWDSVLTLSGSHAPVLVRLVRTFGPPVVVRHELTVGGFDAPRGTWDGARARVGDVDVAVTGPATHESDGPRLRSTLHAGPEWTGLAVTAGGEPVPFDAAALEAALRDADERAAVQLAHAHLPRHESERARDALAVLRACTNPDSGATVASLTTSLPEAIDGNRQFDYRYSWVRDASLAVSVAALLGQGRRAHEYLRFLVKVTDDAKGDLPGPLTDVLGDPVPDEREVDGVAGWAGAQPIRVGNAAAEQVQYDALGIAIEAVSVYLQTGGSLDDGTWHLVRTVADHLADEAEPKSNGIWEFREPRPLVSADIGRWLALDRAVWIARACKPFAPRGRWKEARDELRARVLGAISDDGGLPQSYDDPVDAPRADASALTVVLFGMLRADDARAHRLVDWVIDRLGSGPFLYRYEPDASDGFLGHEGTFVPISWWAVSALALLGRVDEAEARLAALCATLPRLLSEEHDAAAGVSLGNVPLLWSHMEAARALYVVDAARLRARHGALALNAWRVARYCRLRVQHRRTAREP